MRFIGGTLAEKLGVFLVGGLFLPHFALLGCSLNANTFAELREVPREEDVLVAATSLSWEQSSPSNVTTVVATWVKSTSSSLSLQKIQFYSDNTCSLVNGPEQNVNSTTTQSFPLNPVDGTTHSFRILSVDTASAELASDCSSAMVIDRTVPNAASALSWVQTSPSMTTSVSASWTKSNSLDLANQKVQFYADSSCGTTSGSIVDLTSASAQSTAFVGTTGSTYTYKLTSVDAAGNLSVSSCSSAMAIDTTAPNSATGLAWSQTSPFLAAAVTASWTKSNSADLSNQKIQYYADSTCTNTSGSLIDLVSNSVQTNAFTGSNGNTYTYKITSFDTGGNSSVSACSSSMSIDTTLPNAATVLSWAQASPFNSTSVTASWTKSNSGDLANQKIQYYVDASCGTISGSLIDLASNSIQTNAFTGSNTNTYTFQLTSIDTAGNQTVSACSASMSIDTTNPNAATSLSWSQASPSNTTAVTASWTKSTSGDLFNQKIQYYADGSCTSPSGSLIDLTSSALETNAFTGSDGSTYTYKITSFDTAGNQVSSVCSTALSIDGTGPNSATDLSWSQTSPYGGTAVTASWTKSTSGDLSNQKIQYYSDGSCGTPSGSLVDLVSASAQTNAFTGADAVTYTYKITSIDSASNQSISACSSVMTIDTTNPNTANSLSWSQTSPYSGTAVTASWTKSTSGDLSNQKIQYYSDGSCGTPSGSLVDLVSASAQTNAFTGADAVTYTYKITSIDSASNQSISACSSVMTIDTTNPNTANSLSWSQTSPYSGTAVTASWTKSTSGDLSNQKIQYYSDGSCGTPSGSLVDLVSASAQTNAFTGADASTYTYKITSIDSASNQSVSGCSSAMTIDTTNPNAASSLSWSQTSPFSGTAVTASWTKSTSTDLSNQKIQFYSDGSCGTPSGSLVDLVSASAQTNAFIGADASTYTYKITSIDSASNQAVSACSAVMSIDTSVPNAATSLGWVQASPYNLISVTANWSKSNSTDLSNQKIQYYSDGSCGTVSGSLIDLTSATVQTNAFTGSHNNTYTYKLTSFDLAGNSTESTCSSSISIDTVAPTSPNISINSGAPTVDTVNVTLTLSAAETLSLPMQMYITNTAGCSGGSWESYATSKAWTLPNLGVANTVYAKFKDNAGNETACQNDSITHVSFNASWGFTNGDEAQYTLASSSIDFASNKVRLKPSDQTDNDNTATGFAGGTAACVAWDASNSYMRLSAGCSVGGSDLNSSWTPQWSSLASYWQFEGNWDDWQDSNDGAPVNGASFTNSDTIYRGDKAAAFDGTNDYASYGNVFDFTSSDFSIALWIKLNTLTTSVGGQGPVIFFKGQYQVAGYYSQITNDGIVKFYTNQAGVTQGTGTASGAVVAGLWYHLAFTRSGANVKIYINGIDSTSTPGTHVDPTSTADDFVLGYYNNGGSIFMSGYMDDVAVWTASLTAPEVLSVYSHQWPNNTSSPELAADWTPQWSSIVGYWKLNDANGSATAVDSSPLGTNTGSVRAGVKLAIPGRLNGGAELNGNSGNGFINIPNTATLNSVSSMSVAAWIMTPVTWVANQQIFSNQDATNGMNLFLSDGKPAIWTDGGGTFMSPTSIADGHWHHVVGTIGGGTATIYVDGIQVASAARTFSNSNMDNQIGVYCQGAGGTSCQGAFNAYVDEVAVWSNKVLTAKEVAAINGRQAALFSGSLTSRVMDAYSTAQSWTSLAWTPTLPFMKELPDFIGGPQNETSSNYSSIATDTLMNGIVGLWHLNEGSWNGTADEVKDDSGQGNHGYSEGSSGANTTFSGKLDRSGDFNGTKRIRLADNTRTTVGNITNLTISVWVYPKVLAIGPDWTYQKQIFNCGEAIGLIEDAWGGWAAYVYQTDDNYYGPGTSFKYTANQWRHLVMTYDGINVKLYIDGELQGSTPATLPTKLHAGAPYCTIGGSGGTASERYFNGNIDEVGLWTRALSNNEVKQLYRRGANRIKYQVRSCDDSACSGETWLGPDGTVSTYFSELNNNTSPADSSGDVKAALPSITFSAFGSLTVSNNRYFQYRAIFESDDATNLCDYGSGNVACSPELKIATSGPTHYDDSSPTIYNNTGVTFNSLSAFTVTEGICSGGLRYTLSLNKTSWYYWTGTSWSVADGAYTQANDSATVNANIASFAPDGTVYFKAFLKSDGTTPCELDDITFTGLH